MTITHPPLTSRNHGYAETGTAANGEQPALPSVGCFIVRPGLLPAGLLSP